MFTIPKKKQSAKTAGHAPIDEIMKYLFNVSKETLINMLNSIFKQNFSIENATITQTNSEFVDENFDITRGDLFYVVIDDEKKQYNLHIELQTRPDGYLTIRLLQYDIRKAAEIQRLGTGSNIKRYVLPRSVVIHVESGSSIPDYYESEIVDIKADGSEEVIHRIVPVIKYWELTDKDLIEQKLYPLLPLQIFLLRGELKKFAKEKDSEGKNKLIQKIKDLTEKIIIEVKNLAETGQIKKYDDDKIITALARLIKYLNEKYNFEKKLDREVDIMIESVFTTLEKKGIEKGERKAKKEFKVKEKQYEAKIKQLEEELKKYKTPKGDIKQ